MYDPGAATGRSLPVLGSMSQSTSVGAPTALRFRRPRRSSHASVAAYDGGLRSIRLGGSHSSLCTAVQMQIHRRLHAHQADKFVAHWMPDATMQCACYELCPTAGQHAPKRDREAKQPADRVLGGIGCRFSVLARRLGRTIACSCFTAAACSNMKHFFTARDLQLRHRHTENHDDIRTH